MNILAWFYRDKAAVCMVVVWVRGALSAFLFIKLHCKLVLCYACGFKVRSFLPFYCFSGLLCIAQRLLVRRAAFTVISLLIKRTFAVCIEGLVAVRSVTGFLSLLGKAGRKGKECVFFRFQRL